MQRVYVHEDGCETLARRLSDGAGAPVVGDPVDPETEVSPLTGDLRSGSVQCSMRDTTREKMLVVKSDVP